MPLALPWTPPDREAVLHAVVSGGGAMLLAYAWYVQASGRASRPQVRGLVASGVGFLASAGASIFLRDHAVAGALVSLIGCVVALGGMRELLRDRLDRQDVARRHARSGRVAE